MSNNCIIATKQKDIGVYLHWNGGRDSIEAFLTFCKIKGFRSPEQDNYGWAYLTTILGNFFGDGLSVGIDLYDRLGDTSNGVYIIEDWEIVDRKYFSGVEQDSHSLSSALIGINQSQPKQLQITPEELNLYNKKYSTRLALGGRQFGGRRPR